LEAEQASARYDGRNEVSPHCFTPYFHIFAAEAHRRSRSLAPALQVSYRDAAKITEPTPEQMAAMT
jgi:hypothetical protein